MRDEEELKFINILDRNNVPVPKEDWENIRDNPEGLTVEGVKFNVYQHKTRSKNRYIIAKYDKMLKECKNFTKSGKLTDGKTILSRDEQGNVTWSEMINDNFELIKEPLLVKAGV